MGTDAENIQLLKCFQLQNVLTGLCLLLKRITGAKFTTKTLVLDQDEGVKTIDSVFDLSELVSGDNKVVLLAIEIENAGQIILDLFQREKRPSRVQNVSTLTERGSSFLRRQSGVAYVTAHLPREDIQYLTFE